MPAPASITLSTLNGTVAEGNGARYADDDLFLSGRNSAATVGDVNADGFDDFVIGASTADAPGSFSGSAFVVYGTASGLPDGIDLDALDGTDGFQIRGAPANANLGVSVSAAGDFNGDGIDDLIVGASGSWLGGTLSGTAYVVYGGTNLVSATVDVSTLDGSDGFRMDGIPPSQLGFSVSSAGDLNGDGFDDVVVGAPSLFASGVEVGGVYVVFGRGTAMPADLDLGTLNGANGFRMLGVSASEEFGDVVSSAGDVNGDGLADLLVSSWGATGANDQGDAYVLFGRTSGYTSTVSLSSLDGTNGFRVFGSAAFENAGIDISGGGDVNGDGFDDIVVGSVSDVAGANAGAAYVVFGSGSGFSASLNLGTLDGTNGFRIDGASANDRTGTNVTIVGDVDGDGFDDVLIGGDTADPGGVQTGAAYLIFGSASHSASLSVSALDGTNGIRFVGTDVSDFVGYASGAAGDFNADGYADLLIGAYGEDRGVAGESSGYLVYGGSFGGSTTGVSLVGTAGAEVLRGGRGDDVLTGGGGADVFVGGAGDDVFRVGGIASFADISGGTGFDTIEFLDDDVIFWLSGEAFRSRRQEEFTSIEQIDLRSATNAGLSISPEDIYDITEERVDGRAVLFVRTDGDDLLALGSNGDPWTLIGTETIRGVEYERYDVDNATVYISTEDGGGGGGGGLTVSNSIPDQDFAEFEAFSYTLPAGTFSVPLASLTLSAAQADGSPLPSWLEFVDGVFSGVAPIETSPVTVIVTADDGTDTVTDTFVIDFTPPSIGLFAGAGAGDDVLRGTRFVDVGDLGAGDDHYRANRSGDVVLAGADDDTVIGGHGEDSLYGQAGADTLIGNAGDDLLSGGTGADVMRGGAGADTFLFNTLDGSVDRVLDMRAGSDRIAFDNHVFDGLGPDGTLSADAFAVVRGGGVPATTEVDVRLVYDRSTGALWYDADGAGGVAAVEIATLRRGLSLDAGDVLVI